MHDDHRTDFAMRLRRLMDVRGLNAKSLLWMMGGVGSTAKIYSWLIGERLPSCESLYALKAALRCTWDELLGDGDEG